MIVEDIVRSIENVEEALFQLDKNLNKDVEKAELSQFEVCKLEKPLLKGEDEFLQPEVYIISRMKLFACSGDVPTSSRVVPVHDVYYTGQETSVPIDDTLLASGYFELASTSSIWVNMMDILAYKVDLVNLCFQGYADVAEQVQQGIMEHGNNITAFLETCEIPENTNTHTSSEEDRIRVDDNVVHAVVYYYHLRRLFPLDVRKRSIYTKFKVPERSFTRYLRKFETPVYIERSIRYKNKPEQAKGNILKAVVDKVVSGEDADMKNPAEASVTYGIPEKNIRWALKQHQNGDIWKTRKVNKHPYAAGGRRKVSGPIIEEKPFVIQHVQSAPVVPLAAVRPAVASFSKEDRQMVSFEFLRHIAPESIEDMRPAFMNALSREHCPVNESLGREMFNNVSYMLRTHAPVTNGASVDNTSMSLIQGEPDHHSMFVKHEQPSESFFTWDIRI